MSLTSRYKILLLPVAILCIALLGIPLLSLRQDYDLENMIRTNQEEALVLSAQSVSSVLKDKAELFYPEVEEAPPAQEELSTPKIIQLTTPIRLNGDLRDWQPGAESSKIFAEDHLLVWNPDYRPESLSFRHLAGSQSGYLYAFFDVYDDKVVYRNRNSLRLDRADHLKIIIDKDDEQQNYVVSTFEPGWVIGFHIPEDPQKIAAHERRIHGYWRRTERGYRMEIRIQSELLGDRIVFAVADVDDQQTGDTENIIGTGRIEEEIEEEKAIAQEDVIKDILKAQQLPLTRVSILDKEKQVVAELGELHWESNDIGTGNGGSQPVSLPKEIPPDKFTEVFEGQNRLVRYYEDDGPGEVIAALQPIYDGEEVIAATVTEQAIRLLPSSSTQFFRDIMIPLILAFTLGVLGLFFYSRRISSIS